jgi:fumagillin biosynthesis cytochrome P450 monooxygenase
MALFWLTKICIAAVLSVVVYQLYNTCKRDLKLPPGPKPLPIIGNIMDLPPKGKPEFKHWAEHKSYGPISSVGVLGNRLVFLHDRSVVHELLESRSLETSSRPYMEFGHNLCGYGFLLPLKKYGPVFRKQRKIVHQQLGTKTNAAQYQSIQEQEARRFLLRTWRDPENLIQHIKT